MGIQSSNQEVVAPLPDPNKLLEELKKLIESNKSSNSSWVGVLVAVLVAIGGIAIWSWLSFRHNRELAKLRHEKVKTKVLNAQALLKSEIAEGQEQIALSEKEVGAAEERLRVIEADIRREESLYEANLRAIDSIRSWRDVGVR